MVGGSGQLRAFICDIGAGAQAGFWVVAGMALSHVFCAALGRDISPRFSATFFWTFTRLSWVEVIMGPEGGRYNLLANEKPHLYASEQIKFIRTIILATWL